MIAVVAKPALTESVEEFMLVVGLVSVVELVSAVGLVVLEMVRPDSVSSSEDK